MSNFDDALNELEGLNESKRPVVSRMVGKVVSDKKVWTKEQSSIISQPLGKMNIVALAGTGKTSVLMEYARQKSRIKWKYVTYNKSMSEAAQSLFPMNVKGSTFHALAYSRFGPALASKMNRRFSPEDTRVLVGWDKFEGWEMAVAALREWRKGYMASPADFPSIAQLPKQAWSWLNAFPNVLGAIDGTEGFIRAAEVFWQATINPRAEMIDAPMDVMIKLMTLMKGNWGSAGLLVDESQDLSANIIEAISEQEIPVMMVGDPAQDLYEWKGGYKKWPVLEFPVHTMQRSLRFGPEVAELANGVLAQLDRKERLEGANAHSGLAPFAWKKGATWIARTQAGALEGAMDAIKHGYKPVWVGKGTLARIQSLLDVYQGRRVNEPWLAGLKSIKDVERVAAETGAQEWKSGLNLLRKFKAEELERVIDLLASEGENTVSVTTVHQAKGQTFDHVLLGKDMKWEDASHEEKRIQYVALTRSPYLSLMDSDLEKLKSLHQSAVTTAMPDLEEDGF